MIFMGVALRVAWPQATHNIFRDLCGVGYITSYDDRRRRRRKKGISSQVLAQEEAEQRHAAKGNSNNTKIKGGKKKKNSKCLKEFLPHNSSPKLR